MFNNNVIFTALSFAVVGFLGAPTLARADNYPLKVAFFVSCLDAKTEFMSNDPNCKAFPDGDLVFETVNLDCQEVYSDGRFRICQGEVTRKITENKTDFNLKLFLTGVEDNESAANTSVNLEVTTKYSGEVGPGSQSVQVSPGITLDQFNQLLGGGSYVKKGNFIYSPRFYITK